MTLDLRQFKDALDRYLTMPPEDATDADKAYGAAMSGTADGDVPDEWKDFLDEDRQIHVDLWLSANEAQLAAWYDDKSYKAGSLAATDPDVAVGRGDTPEYIDGFCDAMDGQIEKAKAAK